MKLLFANGSRLRFTVETPALEPLGGSESAAAYLCSALGRCGHDVTLMAHLPEGAGGVIARVINGVRHVPLAEAQNPAFFAAQDFDAVITLSAPQAMAHMKQMAPRAVHIAWLHLPPTAAVRELLLKHAPAMDWCVFVSSTQARAVGFPGRTQVIGNAIAPAFESLFASADEIKAAKQNRAAYTAVPDRGLEVLAEVIGRGGLQTDFDIYSGMTLYQQPDDAFAPLYAKLKNLPRCRLHGALGQQALAEALKPAAFLAYPCTVGETYGIAVQEAMAAGLKVVTTDLGHLPHTSMGFADLVPYGENLASRFTTALAHAISQFQTGPKAWAEERFAQVQAVNRDCTWAVRAREWENFLSQALHGRA
jgi:glycosyltransferase involved in cell wall biosynthesis